MFKSKKGSALAAFIGSIFGAMVAILLFSPHQDTAGPLAKIASEKKAEEAALQVAINLKRVSDELQNASVHDLVRMKWDPKPGRAFEILQIENGKLVCLHNTGDLRMVLDPRDMRDVSNVLEIITNGSQDWHRYMDPVEY